MEEQRNDVAEQPEQPAAGGSGGVLEPTAGPEGVNRFLLWFGVLGGAVAWTAHLLLAYAIAEFGCVSPFGQLRWMGITAVAWSVIAVSLLTLLVAVAATWVSQRSARRLVGSSTAADYESADPRVFMARTGRITSGLFVFIILVQTLPVLYYLRNC